MAGISSDPEFELSVSGSIASNGASIELTSPNPGTTAVQISGTWSGTLLFEASVDGTNWETIPSVKLSTSLFVSSFTTNGIYLVPTNSYKQVRIRSSAWSSGTANIASYGADAASLTIPLATLLGATDATKIGNIGDRLKVDANFTVLGGQLVPTITNKFRIRTNLTNVTVPVGYTNLYNRSGTGLFFGFQAAFNSENVTIKLTIDSGIVFELTLADIKQFEFNDTTTTRMQLGGFLTTISNKLDFSSKFPIPYTTSVSIDVKRSDGTNHTNNNWVVFLTEDT